MKFLIAGLGNIGPEYENTRHNIGFKILDELASSSGVFFTTGRYGQIGEWKFKGKICTLLKPSTFMNLSGVAIRYWMQKLNIEKEQFLIVTDDLALPLGKLRLRGKGSDGGHNGLKNISEVLGTSDYPRLRFGVGHSFAKGKQVDYVLGKWSQEEINTINPRILLACDAIKSFCSSGLQHTMTEFNNK